jgi:hypothetical protein
MFFSGDVVGAVERELLCGNEVVGVDIGSETMRRGVSDSLKVQSTRPVLRRVREVTGSTASCNDSVSNVEKTGRGGRPDTRDHPRVLSEQAVPAEFFPRYPVPYTHVCTGPNHAYTHIYTTHIYNHSYRYRSLSRQGRAVHPAPSTAIGYRVGPTPYLSTKRSIIAS